MTNIMKLMQQAASMKKNVSKIQKSLSKRTVEFSSGEGMVTATAKGDLSIVGVSIDPQIIDPSNAKKLEALVCAAVAGALEKAKEMSAEEMGKLAGDMGLPPGMDLPI